MSAPQTFEEYAASEGFDVQEAYRVIGAARRLTKDRPRVELTDEQIAAFYEWEGFFPEKDLTHPAPSLLT